MLKYFLDGSRHVFKVDDIAYNKQVFPVVAGQIGIGCCKRENKRMSKERFYRELVLALPDKANADGWDDAAYFAAKVKKLNESEELKRLGLHFSAIIPYSTSKGGSLWIRIQLASVWTNITRGSTNGKPHKKNKKYGRNEFRWRNGNCCHQS